MLYIRKSWHFLSFMSITSTDIFSKSIGGYSVHVLYRKITMSMYIFAYFLDERNNHRRKSVQLRD